ncbi:MAG: hypothetical protein AAGH15_02725 [Myxococcota bacterium]
MLGAIAVIDGGPGDDCRVTERDTLARRPMSSPSIPHALVPLAPLSLAPARTARASAPAAGRPKAYWLGLAFAIGVGALGRRARR